MDSSTHNDVPSGISSSDVDDRIPSTRLKTSDAGAQKKESPNRYAFSKAPPEQVANSSSADCEYERSFVPFPERLMALLESKKHEECIRWNERGDAFGLIPEDFTQKVLKAHFQGTKFESFTRKLNRWGFKRIIDKFFSEEMFVYRHDMFRRGKPELLQLMKGSDRRNRPDDKEQSALLAQLAADLESSPSVPSYLRRSRYARNDSPRSARNDERRLSSSERDSSSRRSQAASPPKHDDRLRQGIIQEPVVPNIELPETQMSFRRFPPMNPALTPSNGMPIRNTRVVVAAPPAPYILESPGIRPYRGIAPGGLAGTMHMGHPLRLREEGDLSEEHMIYSTAPQQIVQPLGAVPPAFLPQTEMTILRPRNPMYRLAPQSQVLHPHLPPPQQQQQQYIVHHTGPYMAEPSAGMIMQQRFGPRQLSAAAAVPYQPVTSMPSRGMAPTTTTVVYAPSNTGVIAAPSRLPAESYLMPGEVQLTQEEYLEILQRRQREAMNRDRYL